MFIRNKNNGSTACLPGREIVDKLRDRGYEISKTSPSWIAKGGFSSIYLVKNTSSDNNVDVVLKYTESSRVIAEQCENAQDRDADATARQGKIGQVLKQLVYEGKRLSQLHHPMVIRYIAWFTDNGLENVKEDDDADIKSKTWKMSALLVEYCQGGQTMQTEIDKAIETGTSIPISRIRRWFVQLALALDYLHRRGYIHLDVKPANVFFKGSSDADTVTLGDFGLSRTLRSLQDTRQGSHLSSVLPCGVAAFFSPECIQPGWEPKPANDVWSFGAMLYYAVTLDLPFGAGLAAIIAIATTHPKSLHEYGKPPALARLVERLLLKDVSQRPSMDVVVNDPFFDRSNGANLMNIFLKCPANLFSHLKKMPPYGELPMYDAALGCWIEQLTQALEELELQYERWQLLVLGILVPAYEQAASSIRLHAKNAKTAQIVSGLVSIGCGVAVGAGVAITALSLGILTPLGVPLIIGGAVGSGAGNAAALGATIAEKAFEDDNKKEAEKKQRECKEEDVLLDQCISKVENLLPEDECKKAIDDKLKVSTDIFGAINLVCRITGIVVKVGDTTAAVAQIAIRTLGVAARTATIALLPIGVVLDGVTIARAIKKLNKSEVADYLEALIQLLKAKGDRTKALIEYAREITVFRNDSSRKLYSAKAV